MTTGADVLAIDPGPITSGFVLLEAGRVRLLDAAMPNEQLLERIQQADVEHLPLAIEWISSYGMAVGADVFESCYWVGRFDHAGVACRLKRPDIKVHLCGMRNAKDSNIRQALIDRFGGLGGKAAAVGTKKAHGPLYGVSKHAWSALAVAVAWQDGVRSET